MGRELTAGERRMVEVSRIFFKEQSFIRDMGGKCLGCLQWFNLLPKGEKEEIPGLCTTCSKKARRQ